MKGSSKGLYSEIFPGWKIVSEFAEESVIIIKVVDSGTSKM